MLRVFLVVIFLFCQGCYSDDSEPEPTRHIHTSFSDSTGLMVSNSDGLSQQLIKESLDVRVVASKSAQWLIVEDMQLSNLVIIRTFRLNKGKYEEVELPEIKSQWETLADQADISYENLIQPRIGIEGMGISASGETVLLHFRADTGNVGYPEIDSVVEVSLD